MKFRIESMRFVLICILLGIVQDNKSSLKTLKDLHTIYLVLNLLILFHCILFSIIKIDYPRP